MDRNTDLLEVQCGERTPTSIRDRLKQIEPTKWDPARLQWLWEMMMQEDYAADDVGAGNSEVFISNLFQANTRHYEYGDEAYIAILNIIAKVNADMHFAVWGDVPIKDIMACHEVLAKDMFETMEVNRLTAYIPSFNKKMIRFATVLGYKYEGEIRQIFLKNGTYHNLFVYGLLKAEWLRRKGV